MTRNCSSLAGWSDSLRVTLPGADGNAMHDPNPSRHATTSALLELECTIDPLDLFPVLLPAAGELVRADPYAFTLATSLDRGTPARMSKSQGAMARSVSGYSRTTKMQWNGWPRMFFDKCPWSFVSSTSMISPTMISRTSGPVGGRCRPPTGPGSARRSRSLALEEVRLWSGLRW